jgi:hypothetical protein
MIVETIRRKYSKIKNTEYKNFKKRYGKYFISLCEITNRKIKET